ncbi:MAG: hypothetical protein IJW48_03160 [Clostridia bacterium]|nr:hypothetical protein [Clostridia bacterium]
MAGERIAFRCSACGGATLGLLGGITRSADMLRVRCTCGESALDVKKKGNGGLHLSVPCVYCRDNHGFSLSLDAEREDNTVRLPCPFSNMDIAFIGNEESVTKELERTGEELMRVIRSFEGEELSDIQPSDADEGDVCDPAVYDTVNFLVRDLEAEGRLTCPCGEPKPELRFSDEGIQVFCTSCGASYTFYAKSGAMAESYLSLDSLELS